MGFSDEWLMNARDALTQLRGPGSLDHNGVVMPACSAIDTISIIGQLTQPVMNATANFEKRTTDRTVVCASTFLTNGQIVLGEFLTAGTTAQWDIRSYLGGFGQPGVPWARSPGAGGWVLGNTFEPFVFDEGGAETDILGFVREMIGDWQACCDASAQAILLAGTDATQVMGQQESDVFWGAIGSLCSALDVLKETPIESRSEKLKGALRAAAATTEQFIGKAAADISNEVGKAAGNVASGFFGEAGVLSIAVAGIALYLFLK